MPDAPPARDGDELVLSIAGVTARPAADPSQLDVEINSSRGTIRAHLHPCPGRTGCAVFVGGAAGGVEGPANGVYARLARDLVAAGVTSLRVEYRQPNELTECVLDALGACSVLRGIGGERIVLVGHSFGGAVAIKAGGLSPAVSAVAALSPQRFGTAEVGALGKPLLLVHGSADEILLPQASEDIYSRAAEPKRLVLLEGAGHGLREAAEEVYQLLDGFIREHAAEPERG